MTTHALPVRLTDAEVEEFGREIDAIRDEVMASRGARDRRYICGSSEPSAVWRSPVA
jgi:linoleoyl-CoA desaturase